jgi:MFS family permease
MGAAAAGLKTRAFRALQHAEVTSTAGDQLAKVALSIVVFNRTGSAAWSGFAYALTLLPPLITARALAPLADRYPRRAVMITCGRLQAGAVLVMAWPGVPLPLFAVGVAAVSTLSTPYRAAQGAIVLDLVGHDATNAGSVRLLLIREVGQVAGLARAVTGTLRGVLSSALRTSHGMAVLAGGFVADRLNSAAWAITAAGALGTVLAGGSALRWQHIIRTRGD